MVTSSFWNKILVVSVLILRLVCKKKQLTTELMKQIVSFTYPVKHTKYLSCCKCSVSGLAR